jgi:hypothetical protein
MFEWLNLHVASLVVVALIIGAMACYGGLVTRQLYKHMERNEAEDFLARLFPIYSRTGAIFCLIAAAPLLPGRSYEVEIGILMGVSAAFLIGASILSPAINKAREVGDEGRFSKLHMAGDVLQLAQFIAIAIVLIRLAQ